MYHPNQSMYSGNRMGLVEVTCDRMRLVKDKEDGTINFLDMFTGIGDFVWEWKLLVTIV